MMPSRPMDAKPLFHSGVAPLRSGASLFLTTACSPWPGAPRHSTRGPDPSIQPHSRSPNPGPGAARGGGRPESTTPKQRTRDRGQRSAAAPRRQLTSPDPAAPGATSSITRYRSCRTVSIYPYVILRITYNRYPLLRFYNLPLIIAHPMNAHNPSIKLRPSPRGWALHFRAIR